jgi:putative PIN family toxin of toxin-antitoxin system
MKVVIDTNLIISGFINKNGTPSQLIQTWKEEKFEWLMSNSLFFELQEVFLRPYIKDKYNISLEEITLFLEYLENACTIIEINNSISKISFPFSNDIKDDKVLHCTIEGKANYLITGDKKDLLSLKDHPALAKLQIVTAREFLNRFAEKT